MTAINQFPYEVDLAITDLSTAIASLTPHPFQLRNREIRVKESILTLTISLNLNADYGKALTS